MIDLSTLKVNINSDLAKKRVPAEKIKIAI